MITADLSSEDKEAPLREDIRFLGRLLGDTLREEEGNDAFATVEHIRWRSGFIAMTTWLHAINWKHCSPHCLTTIRLKSHEPSAIFRISLTSQKISTTCAAPARTH